jgi:cation diffusion facilitator family transporter
MHLNGQLELRHGHVYLDEHHRHGERRTKFVVALTAAMMVVEIAGGLMFNSMALLADGLHMGSHVVALGLAAFAYVYARRHAEDDRFTFGTGKVGALSGFTSAIILGLIALIMAWESANRLMAPVPIDFRAATLVAIVGLAVNLISAVLLHRDDHHHADHDEHSHGLHKDHNLRAAYLHVLADALTSVLAIVALVGGRSLGWVWLDPVMGMVGAAVILWWSYGLLRPAGRTLLDAEVTAEQRDRIRRLVEADADNLVLDLHVWRVGSQHLAAIIALATHEPQPPAHYKELLAEVRDLAHVTVEVNPCQGRSCKAA